MTASDSVSEQPAGLIAAAQAMASWAHARRARWTNVPLAAVAARAPAPAPIKSVISAALPPPVAVLVAPVPVANHPATTPASTPSRLPTALIGRWLLRGGIAAAVIAAAIVGGQYAWNALSALPARTATVKPAAPVPAPAAPPSVRKATSGVRISTTPPGAQVLVDGKARGVTPLSLTGLSPGRHEIEMNSDAGTVRRSVTIAANETATIDEAIFSGWITIYSPFDVSIAENGKVLRADERNQIMLSAGTHELRLTNRALGYDAVKQVEVKPGASTVMQVTPEPSPLTVTATEPAEVWIDGARIGDTPLNAAPVALGSHEVIVKRAAGGERRFTITIGAKPYTLNVEF